MARKPRISAPTLAHHVVHRGIDRQLIFLDDHDRYAFLLLLRKCIKKYHFSLLAFCLMGNHFHLFVQEVHGELSVAMQFLNGLYTTCFNRKHSREGALLRGRFFSKPVYEDRYALILFHYIHMNPVKAGLATSPSSYAWSSFHDYTDKPRFELVDARRMTKLVAGKDSSRRAVGNWLLHLDTSEPRGERLTLPGDLDVAGGRDPMLRAEDMHRRHLSPAADKSSKPRRLSRCRRTIAAYARTAGVAYEELQGPLKHSRFKVKIRNAALVDCATRQGASYAELARLFGLTAASVANTLSRARRNVDETALNVEDGSDPRGVDNPQAPRGAMLRARRHRHDA